MWKKSDDYSKEDIARLLKSPEAMQLAHMLRQMDVDALNRAASAASQGNTAQAQEALNPLLQDPKIKELLSKLGGNHG